MALLEVKDLSVYYGVINALKSGLKDGLEILGMSEDLQIRCVKI